MDSAKLVNSNMPRSFFAFEKKNCDDRVAKKRDERKEEGSRSRFDSQATVVSLSHASKF
jgi:hypothetical protein